MIDAFRNGGFPMWFILVTGVALLVTTWRYMQGQDKRSRALSQGLSQVTLLLGVLGTVLGLIATRSLDGQVQGIIPLVADSRLRIANGVKAYDALERIKANPKDAAARAEFDLRARDLGYGLLLKRYVADPRKADAALIDKAAWDTVPNVPVMFWIFRIMAELVDGFETLCAFTHGPGYFVRMGFSIVPHHWVREKILVDCQACPLFRTCGQHAVVLPLTRAASRRGVR
mgnify:CR=1 FL=1